MSKWLGNKAAEFSLNYVLVTVLSNMLLFSTKNTTNVGAGNECDYPLSLW